MKFKTANGMIAYHEGIPCPEDPGMTDSEWLLWQKAINHPGPYDSIVGWQIMDGEDVIESYLDFNMAIDSCIDGYTIRQVNKSDLIDDVIKFICPDCEGEGEINGYGCGRCGGSGDFYPVFDRYQSLNENMKVYFQRFKWEQDAADFATLHQENLISICWDGNNPEEPWVVFYKSLR